MPLSGGGALIQTEMVWFFWTEPIVYPFRGRDTRA
jgi:hypothetical protein